MTYSKLESGAGREEKCSLEQPQAHTTSMKEYLRRYYFVLTLVFVGLNLLFLCCAGVPVCGKTCNFRNQEKFDSNSFLSAHRILQNAPLIGMLMLVALVIMF